jgi:hypothetical protein
MKKTIEMRFDGAAIHAGDGCNFVVSAALEQQIDDLLFALAQANGSPLIHCPSDLVE